MKKTWEEASIAVVSIKETSNTNKNNKWADKYFMAEELGSLVAAPDDFS